MRALLFLVAALSSACARPPDAMATRERQLAASSEQTERLPCAIDGSMRLDATAQLYGDADGVVPFAGFDAKMFELTVLDLPELVMDRIGVRASNGKGFALDGWIDRDRLHFTARQRIPLAGEVAWIPQGASLTVKVSATSKVVVSPSTKHLAPIEALVACNAVAIGAIEAEDRLTEVGDLYAPVSDRIPISARPGGPPIFTLRMLTGTHLALSVQDTGSGLRLRFQDGIAIDGYVEQSSLTRLMSLSMSGCGCCGLSVGHGKVGLPSGARFARARRATRVEVGAKERVARGRLSRGAEVIVLEEAGAFARVLPRCRELIPAGDNAFWVTRADLESSPASSAAVDCR